MKTIGLIGGLSWFSTSIYYKEINEAINRKLGKAHSAKILMYSVDLEEVFVMQRANDWANIEKMLVEIALKLETGGADCLVVATNSLHMVADNVQAKIKIPLLHIGDAIAGEIKNHGITKVGLLGTKFTMENPFMKDRLAKYGIETIVPDATDRDYIHTTIYNQLTKGIFTDETRRDYSNIINELKAAGAQGAILGCTEIPLLIQQKDSSLPVFDTTTLHALAAAEFALG